ncbi:hypothetical protein CLU79DRAFT_892498 [Phycomyces nitens]|nr:hypothetical protein CLU79DRAFT_892498 [Phycomyces nitens]
MHHTMEKKAKVVKADERIKEFVDRMAKLHIFLVEQLTSHPKRIGWNNCKDKGHDASVCNKTCKLRKGFEQPAGHHFFKCPKLRSMGFKGQFWLNIEIQPTKEDEEANVESKRIKIQDLLKDEYNPINDTTNSVERKQQPERTSGQTDAPTPILRVSLQDYTTISYHKV